MNSKITKFSDVLCKEIFLDNMNISLVEEYSDVFDNIDFKSFIIYQMNYFPPKYCSILYLKLLKEWSKIEKTDIIEIINGVKDVLDLTSFFDFFIHYFKINMLEIVLLSNQDVYCKLTLFEYYKYYYIDNKLDIFDRTTLEARGYSLELLENTRNRMSVKTIFPYSLGFITQKKSELEKEARKKYGIFLYYKRKFDLKSKLQVRFLNLYRRIRY